MKLINRFSLSILTLALTSIASAQTIHTAQVANAGYHDITAHIVWNVGTWKDNTCVINKSVQGGDVTFPAHSLKDVRIDGDKLAEAIGSDYNCADSILDLSDQQMQHDVFKIYKRAGVYVDTSPNFVEIALTPA
jgi:hypothetical protein